MKCFDARLSLIGMLLLIGSYMLVRVPLVQARRALYDPRERGMTPREMFSRGTLRYQEQRRRERLRQLRIQDARMPRDIRVMAPLAVGRPGEARPEIIDYLHRDRTSFIAGGWLWNDPVKGYSYSLGDMVEYDITDPEGHTIHREEPLVEWWEVSERSREQRAEFFRARFGAAQQLRVSPTQEGELPQTGGMGASSFGGGGGASMGLPGGGP
jgi:hypothetical protein